MQGEKVLMKYLRQESTGYSRETSLIEQGIDKSGNHHFTGNYRFGN